MAVASASGRPVTADFNGDGRADAVVPLAASDAAAVMLSAPAGEPRPAASLAVPSPGAVAVGDTNRDGLADVMVAGTTGAVSGFPGNGDGTFGPQVPSPGRAARASRPPSAPTSTATGSPTWRSGAPARRAA